MADRGFHRKQALEKEIKDLHASVNIGATGAPTIASAPGVASVVRNGAGDYTVTLQDKFVSLRFFEVMHKSSSAEDLTFQMHSESVASAKTVRFLCLTAGTPTDPANGDVLFLKFELKNTSAL